MQECIADRISKVLDAQSETLPEISRQLGLTAEQLAQWRTASDEEISAKQRIALCRAGRISADWILGLEPVADASDEEFTFPEEAASAVAALIRRFTHAIEQADIPPKQKIALLHGLLTNRERSEAGRLA